MTKTKLLNQPGSEPHKLGCSIQFQLSAPWVWEGCCIRAPPTGWLKTMEICCLTGVETNFKIKVLAELVSSKAMRKYLFHCSCLMSCVCWQSLVPLAYRSLDPISVLIFTRHSLCISVSVTKLPLFIGTLVIEDQNLPPWPHLTHYICRDCFQMKSHSELLGARVSTQEFQRLELNPWHLL